MSYQVVSELELRPFVCEDMGPSPVSLVIWFERESVSSARVDPAPNVYLGLSEEGKQEGCAKVHDGWRRPPIAIHD